MKKITTTILLIATLCCFVSALSSQSFATSKYDTCGSCYVASAEELMSLKNSNIVELSKKKEIYDAITPEMIEFFEEFFVKKNIITSLRKQRVEKMMRTYKVSENKLYALIALQYVCAKNNNRVSLQQLSKKSNTELVSLGKKEFERFYNNLPEEEKKQINEEFEKMKKKGKMPQTF